MVQAVRGIVGDKSKYSAYAEHAVQSQSADACHRLDLDRHRAFLDPDAAGCYPDELFAITKVSIRDWSHTAG